MRFFNRAKPWDDETAANQLERAGVDRDKHSYASMIDVPRPGHILINDIDETIHINCTDLNGVSTIMCYVYSYPMGCK